MLVHIWTVLNDSSTVTWTSYVPYFPGTDMLIHSSMPVTSQDMRPCATAASSFFVRGPAGLLKIRTGRGGLRRRMVGLSADGGTVAGTSGGALATGPSAGVSFFVLAGCRERVDLPFASDSLGPPFFSSDA